MKNPLIDSPTAIENTAPTASDNQSHAYCPMKHPNGMQAWVFNLDAAAIAAALFEEQGCSPCNLAGRGAMLQFPWREGRTGLVRLCRRGGLMGHLLRNRYLLRNRPLQEFHLHRQVRERGIPAPTLLGVCWKRHGCWYSGALATELAPGCDLDAWLNQNQDLVARETLLRECGRLIRNLHDAGIYHADLQVKNIFVSDGGPMLLDFDRARIGAAVSSRARARNLLRLRRSVEKRGHGAAATRALWDGYGNVVIPGWLDRAYRIRECFSDMIRKRRL